MASVDASVGICEVSAEVTVDKVCEGIFDLWTIACDDKYGDNEFTSQMQKLGLNRLYLHAKTLTFTHPGTGNLLTCEAPLDNALSNVLEKLKRK